MLGCLEWFGLLPLLLLDEREEERCGWEVMEEEEEEEEMEGKNADREECLEGEERGWEAEGGGGAEERVTRVDWRVEARPRVARLEDWKL